MHYFIILLLSSLALSYQTSDHFDGKKFFNPHGDDLKSIWQVMKWKFTSTPAKWPKHVPIKNYPLKVLSGQEEFNVTFINHSTFFIQYQDLYVLTDPIFSLRASPVGFLGPKRVKEPGLAFDLLPRLDVILISHNHYDHLDLDSIKMIDAKFHPLFLVPLGNEKLLLKEGVQNVKALDWWEEIKIKNISFTFAPAQHWSARSLWDRNETLWGSFMLESSKSKIYFGGDTGLGPHFLEIKKRLGSPDLALLPIGAYRPKWFMKNYHLSPEEAVIAHREIGAKKSIGIHFGTFQLSDESIDDPVIDLKKALKKFNISDEEFIILDQGQTFIKK